MAKPQDIVSDPDFWHPDVTDETRSWVLSQNDPTFAKADPATKTKLLKSLGDQNRQGQQIAQTETQHAEQSQSLFNKYVAQPLNNIVGAGMEAATQPLVTAARMAQGEPFGATSTPVPGTGQSVVREGAAAGGPIGVGGEAGTSRRQMGSAVVPQEAWQAGLMAAGPLGKAISPAVPLLGKAGVAGAAARTGLGALLGGAGEAVLGDQSQGVGERALKGGVKAGAMQGAVEAISPLSSFLDRHMPGSAGRVNAEDVARTGKAIGQTVPEFSGAPKKPAQFGQYFEGGGAARDAEAAFANRVAPLDDLVAQNGTRTGKWIQSPELQKAFKTVEKMYKDKPGGSAFLDDIRPDAKMGFLPTQAAKILARYREAVVGAGNERMSGHIAQGLVDEVLQDVVRNMPADVGKQFLGAREGFGAASSVRDVLSGAIKPSPKGYKLDMRGPQAAIEEAGNTRRLPEGGAALREALMRGKGAPPGSQDFYPGEGQYMPFPSPKGAAVFTGRKLLHGTKYVGQKPLTTPVGRRNEASGLGALLTGKATKEEEK